MISNPEPTATAVKPGLIPIQTAAKHYADARGDLGQIVGKLNEKIDALKREALPDLKRLVARAAERKSQLGALIEAAPELFAQPRTCIFHGIKVGLQKGKGGLEIADPVRTLERIKELFDCPENYIRIKETPDKDALARLPAADLKKLGCMVVDTGDEIIIKAADSEVEKMVDALLKGAEPCSGSVRA